MTPRTRCGIASLGSCLLALVSSGCALDHDHAAEAAHGSGAGAAHWSYSGSTGPMRWSELDPSYHAAAQGASQSPVDIPTAKAIKAELPALAFTSAPIPLRIVNNGHTVMVRGDDANFFRFGDEKYSLAQLHFHSPSEHTLDGKPAAIEMHMVHRSEEGRPAVVAVMLVEGAANQGFEPIWSSLPMASGPERSVAAATVDPGALLPTDRDYFFYDGSLTTPPCTEGVRWFVLKTPVAMSASQIASFRKAFDGNNRPVQPHNARLILQR